MMLKHGPARREAGFTLVELLVTITVIGILAAIAIPVFLTQRNKAMTAAARTQMRHAINEIVLAREATQKPTMQITGSNCTDCACRTVNPMPRVADPGFTATPCGTAWANAATKIAAASGSPTENVRAIFTDPWGHPILLDENESETGCASHDNLSSIGPADHWSGFISLVSVNVPLGGFC